VTLVVGQAAGGARQWMAIQAEGMVRRMAGRQSDRAAGVEVRHGLTF
jgi:hypothetical protein